MRATFKSKTNFEDTKSYDAKEPRVEDLVDKLNFPNKEWVQLRFVGPVVSYGRHWVKTKKKDGGETKFPVVCLAFDSETGEMDSEKSCPWCDGEHYFSKESFANAIVRSLQEDEPERKKKLTAGEEETGKKEKTSKSWTPVRVIRLTSSTVKELKKLVGLNRHLDKKSGEKKSFPLSHVKYGCDSV